MTPLGRILLALLLACALALPGTALAQVRVSSGGGSEPLTIVRNGSSVLTASQDVTRVSIGAPEIAEVLVLSPRQITVTGKKEGRTSLTLWGSGDRLLASYAVTVAPDMNTIKEALFRVLPEERDIRVAPTGDGVSLSGSVSSAVNLDRALAVARAVAGEKVNNFLSVGGVHQIMLEVRVAEMSRELLRSLGVNLNYIFKDATAPLNGNSLYTFLDNLTGFDDQGRFILSKATNFATAIPAGNGNIGLYLKALKENGLVKILAEPNLITLSGKRAEFLAGGEIPVPVPQGLGTVAIEYKKFGVGLVFKPTALAGGRINLEVEPEVSELDFANATSISGFTIPAFRVRRVNTNLELNAGQSFAIAGLIQDQMRETMRRLPIVGDVPVLGALFRSSDFQKSETELVIIVTPRLVKPLDMANQRLPTDGFEEPGDFEFYFLGRLQSGDSRRTALAEMAGRPLPTPGRTGFDGPFGHTLPSNRAQGARP